jgi:hypothetical protein
MKTAILRPPSGAEKYRFEVHSTPSRGRTHVQKWYMKANHPVEASRWTQAISRAIEHAKQSPKASESDTSSISRYSIRGTINSTISIPKKDRDAESVSSSFLHTDDEGVESLVREDSSPRDREIDEKNDASSANDSTDRIYDTDVPPHEAFELYGNSTAAQLELTMQLLSDMSPPSTTVTRVVELNGALKGSLGTVQSMLNEYLHMVKERDDWWKARLTREQRRQTVWEQSLQSVVQEGEALERELRRHSRKHIRIDSSTSGGEGLGTVKARPSALPLSPPVEEAEFGFQHTPSTAVPIALTGERQSSPDLSSGSASASMSMALTCALSTTSAIQVARRMSMPRPSSVGLAGITRSGEEEAVDTDEEDEFFDAIETNALPNLVVNEALAGPSEPLLPEDIDKIQYEGYQIVRRELDLESDNRPPTSLWSVLKHSIGKDLTKISFPVFFNEPTSMLQRMV